MAYIERPNETEPKILVAYYSRRGTTKIVAELIASRLSWDIDEIFDTKNRGGIIGYLRAGRDAGDRNLTEIRPIKNDPGQYYITVIGTPVWNDNVSTPIRTYIMQHRECFKAVAFFCTQDAESTNAFDDMEHLAGKVPLDKIALRRKGDIQGEIILKRL